MAGIPFGNAAFALARARQAQAQPENLDAVKVLDTQANLGAASTQAAQAVGEKAAKAKPAKFTFDVTPDGQTVMHAENVPVKSPAQQVSEAQSAPFAHFADTLKAALDQSSREYAASPDPEKVSDDPQDHARELGITQPGFDMSHGVIGMLAKGAEYRKLLASGRLKQAVQTKRRENRDAILTSGAKAAGDVKQLESMQLAIDREKRLQEQAGRQDAKFIDGMLTSDKFHINRIAENPDDAVKYMKNLAQAHGEEWNDELYGPLVRMKYAQGMHDDAKVEHDEKTKAARDDATLSHLVTSTEALRKTLEDKNKGSSDADKVADAIVNGEQPPELTGLYRNTIAVRAALSKRGYNLVHAQEDWNAMKKRISTMNGAQMVRLQQAVNFTSDSLDVVEDLAKQWKASGFPLLNKGRLAAAKSGALGPDAQSLATRLDSQISDMVSELGTVYRGGNASTDEALKLAANNLKTEWSEKTLLDNVGLVRKNLQIRKNSMAAASSIPGNQYSQSQTPAPGAADPLGIRKFLPKAKKP